MQKGALIAVGAGIASIVISLPAFTGSSAGVLLFYLAALPLYMAGLALGPTAGVIAAAAGMIGAGLAGGSVLAGVYGITHALPALIVSRRALLKSADGEWFPVGRIVSSLSMTASAILVASSVWVSSQGGGLEAVIIGNLSGSELLVNFAGQLNQMQPGGEPVTAPVLARVVAPVLPGVMGLVWVMTAVINAVIAQSILVKAGRNLRPTPKYTRLALPDVLSFGLISAALAVLVFSGEVEYAAQNVVLALAAPFVFAGLGAVHRWARGRSHPTAILIAVYVVLLWLGWPVVLITALGMYQQWSVRSNPPAAPGGGSSPGPSS